MRRVNCCLALKGDAAGGSGANLRGQVMTRRQRRARTQAGRSGRLAEAAAPHSLVYTDQPPLQYTSPPVPSPSL